MALLEIQVAETDERVVLLEGDVNFLFDEQVIQDERIFLLEQTSIETKEDVDSEVPFGHNFEKTMFLLKQT